MLTDILERTAFVIWAQLSGQQELFAPADGGAVNAVLGAAVFLLLASVLIVLWRRIFRHHAHSASVVPAHHAYTPSFHVVLATVASAAGLFFLSIRITGGIVPFRNASDAAVFFGVLGVIGVIAEYFSPRAKHAVFAFTVGTLITFILIGFHRMLFVSGIPQNPYFMALGIVCVVLLWKFLFGPWKPQVKAGVLGTFVLWVALHLLFRDPPEERMTRLLVTGIAFVPAVIWCMLFLKDHMQRLSMVVLMFLSGMLSTAPILFYDSMVRHGAELQFFLFRIVPENFSSTSNAFVTGNLVGITGVRSTLMVTLISFLLVGLIEEVSKFWVMR
ncbi:hypothetical protein FJZ28_02465, partial [Candidatus Peregrinibacteria bacterium]|nr:hypothetical protein [Candidatus Peregrinibacteria bacterium]